MDVPLCGSYIKNDDAMWVKRYERFIAPTIWLSWESRTFPNRSENGLRTGKGRLAWGFIIVRRWGWGESSFTLAKIYQV